MQKIYSFLEINSLIVLNAPGISSTGEMSAYAKTYVPNNSEPYIKALSNIRLNYINKISEGTVNPGEDNSTNIFNAFDTLATRINGTVFHSGTATPDFAWASGLIDATVGAYDIAVQNDEGIGAPASVGGGNYIPEWFDVLVSDTVNLFYYRTRIYTTDSYFRDNYPLTYYTVVPPITNTLDFLNNFTIAKNIINNRSIGQHIDNAQIALDGKVITGLECVTLRVYNTANPSDFFDCPFFIGYNGSLGINFTGMIDAIADFLLSLGGGFDIEDWIAAIPELDNLGTYFVIPMWDHISIPNPNPLGIPIQYNPFRYAYNFDDSKDNYTMLGEAAGYLDGLYDPVVNTNISKVKEYLEYGCGSYKSLGFFIIPKSINAEAMVKFSERYPDFIIANINTLDSAAISAPTENTIRDLHMLMQYAESWNGTDPLPAGYTSETVGDNPNPPRYITLTNPYGRAKLYVLIRIDFDASLHY